MKVLFLDIDGVLNCRSTTNKCRWADGHEAFTGVEQSMCERLRRIILSTNARVVLSSTWRKHRGMLPYLFEMLGSEVTLRHIGSTPIMNGASRGDEIKAWLVTHPGVERIAILDDDCDMQAVREYHIQINPEVGLTDANADEAIQRLNA